MQFFFCSLHSFELLLPTMVCVCVPTMVSVTVLEDDALAGVTPTTAPPAAGGGEGGAPFIAFLGGLAFFCVPKALVSSL